MLSSKAKRAEWLLGVLRDQGVPIDTTTKTTKMPIHGRGAAQKMRQLSPHHAAPSPTARCLGGGALGAAAAKDGALPAESGASMLPSFSE